MKILISALFAAGLFVGIILCLRIGWRTGRRRLAKLGESGQAGLGAVEGAVFGLMGLLIAFTFTGAANRFNQRRDLITQQVNCIGTAWLRLDLLQEQPRRELQGLFRDYVDAVLEMGRHADEQEITRATLAALESLQAQIWSKALEAARQEKAQQAGTLILPAVNQMFDSAASRVLAARQHPPVAIYLMLGLLVQVSALMAGFGMAKAPRQSPLHLFGFALIVALSVYLILDLEFPRLGLVRITNFDRALMELRESME